MFIFYDYFESVKRKDISKLSTFNLRNCIYKDSIDVLLLPIDSAEVNDILSKNIKCISLDFDKWLE